MYVIPILKDYHHQKALVLKDHIFLAKPPILNVIEPVLGRPCLSIFYFMMLIVYTRQY